MAAYVFVNIEVTDPERYAEYIRVAPPTLVPFGGRYIARGGRAETLEGIVAAKRVVLLEFPSVEKAKEWWASDVYRGPKAIRQSSASTSMIVVEGVGPGGP
jgi:uncharacterized protein (DUF1330 family)